jgi:hypothetical protein
MKQALADGLQPLGSSYLVSSLGEAMEALVRRMYITRSERIDSRPDRFQSYATFNKRLYTEDNEPAGAQFTDISFSGMRLLSRQRNELKVGELLSVEFTLPGTTGQFKARAKVTRCNSEFDFAVHFVRFEDGQDYRKALARYNEITKRGSAKWFVLGALKWMHEHRQGLALFLFAFLLTAAAFSWIALSSDELQGRDLRSWGANYPKEWFSDYYSKFNKP